MTINTTAILKKINKFKVFPGVLKKDFEIFLVKSSIFFILLKIKPNWLTTSGFLFVLSLGFYLTTAILGREV